MMKIQPELIGDLGDQRPFSPALWQINLINSQLSSYFPKKDQLIPSHPVLPLTFKVKLLAYLSHFCSVSFCTNYHRQNLYNLGMGKKQVQDLLNLPTPNHENDLKVDLRVLKQSKHHQLTENIVEKSLLRCAVLMFFQPAQATTCRLQIKQFLGRELYEQLVTYLSYLKFCYQWIESYPELFPKKYQNYPEIFQTVYQKEPRLKAFFQPVNQGNINGYNPLITSENNLNNSPNLSLFSHELENFLNSIPDQISVIEAENKRIIWANAQFAQRLGFQEGDLIQGKPLEECFTSSEILNILENHNFIVNSGTPLKIQESYQRNEEVYYLDTLKVPLKKSGDQVYAILSISRDITELINHQNRLSDRNNELEIINQELEQFSYSVSHDLQSPLRVMDGFSQILSKKYENNLDETAKHYLQRIRANCQRMGNLIRDLLQLSRISCHSLSPQLINLSAIAEEITTELKTTTPDRNVEFRITPNLITQADPQLIYLVLQNLLQNAWKYTSHHSKALIEFSATVIDGTKVYFVRDDGAGFDMTYVDKLFQPFERLHPESEFPGNGVGLATVKKIITRHGGDIKSESAIEQGATFYFTLS